MAYLIHVQTMWLKWHFPRAFGQKLLMFLGCCIFFPACTSLKWCWMFVEVNPHDRLVVNVDLPEDESMVEKEAFGWMEVAYVYQSTSLLFLVPSQWTGMASWKVTIFPFSIGDTSWNGRISIIMLVFPMVVTCWFLPTMNHPKEGKLFKSDLPSFWGIEFVHIPLK